jgi:hypothetical protein
MINLLSIITAGSLLMKITDVEAIVVREPGLDGAIADGSQDDLVVRISS